MSYAVASAHPFWIDWPTETELKYPFEQICGWIGVVDTGEPFCINCDGVQLPTARVLRPDIAGRPHIGFSTFLDLSALLTHGLSPRGSLTLQLSQGQVVIEEAVFPIGDTAWALCETISENRKVKREFIQNNVKRPVLFLPGCQAPSALPDDWSIPPELCHKADIASAHFYGSVIHEFLSPFGSNAFILDAGAGLRRLPTQNVINMDIYDYPSTDILAIGEDLPFVDNAFDAVLSLAVLEHVKDPFRCAKELVRVTKPGGKIMSIIPFLQAEHGYPSHYANFTRHGIRELFKDGTVVENHFLERSNQPIFVLNQVLGLYASGLPGQVRERFLDMTVRELLSQSPDCYIDQEAPIVESLNEETRWIIASGTTLIVRKTSGS